MARKIKSLSDQEFKEVAKFVEKLLIDQKGVPLTQKDIQIEVSAKGLMNDWQAQSRGDYIRQQIIPHIEKKWEAEKSKHFLCTGSKGFHTALNREQAKHSINSLLSRIRKIRDRANTKRTHFLALWPDGDNQGRLGGPDFG